MTGLREKGFNLIVGRTRLPTWRMTARISPVSWGFIRCKQQRRGKLQVWRRNVQVYSARSKSFWVISLTGLAVYLREILDKLSDMKCPFSGLGKIKSKVNTR